MKVASVSSRSRHALRQSLARFTFKASSPQCDAYLRLRRKRQRLLFAPALSRPATPSEKQKWRALHADLDGALFFAESEHDLALGAAPGPRTFAFPESPDIAARFLLSAERLVTTCAEIARFATRAGVEVALLGEPGLPAFAPAPRRHYRSHRVSTTLELATVCDFAFLPSLLGLVENMLAVHGPGFRIHLLTLDSVVRPFLERHYPEIAFRFYRLDEIAEPEAFAELARRPIGIQAVCGKMWLLRRALEEVRGPILYTDLDVCFFRSPRGLVESLAGVLLFPNWSDSPEHRRLCGLFNGGMMGVAPGAEPFLRWLESLSLFKCDEAPGFFFEQGYLDLAPLLFENVKIHRAGDEDVAPWNLRTLDVTARREGIGSYHAQAPDPLGLFATKAAWDQLATLYSPLDEYPESFFPAILQAQRYAWPEVNRFLFTSETLAGRLKLPRIPVTPRLAKVFCEGVPARALRAASVPYSRFRKLKRRWLGADRESLSWAAAHREAIRRAREHST